MSASQSSFTEKTKKTERERTKTHVGSWVFESEFACILCGGFVAPGSRPDSTLCHGYRLEGGRSRAEHRAQGVAVDQPVLFFQRLLAVFSRLTKFFPISDSKGAKERQEE